LKIKINDRRKFGGTRVAARCEVILESQDIFSCYENNRAGYMSLNVRGGIFYLNDVITNNNFEKMFPDGNTAVFKELKLISDSGKKVLIKNIKVMFIKKKEGADRQGIVFRFVDLSEEHLDILLKLSDVLPVLGPQEAMSIPSHDYLYKMASN
jgi:hypothetical protein